MENVDVKQTAEQVKQEVKQTADQVKQEVADVEEHTNVQEALHRVALATVGTFALVGDELEHFINKAIERGQIAEKDARKQMQDVTEKRKGAEKGVDKRFEELVARLNIPTKNDINTLNEKIADLTKKVDSLKN